MADEKNLIDAIEQLVARQWEERKAPLLFAAIPPQIRADVPDYQEILNGRNLTHFVRDNMLDKVKRVGHPTQKSKIGLIPLAEEYSFPIAEENELSEKQVVRQSVNKKHTYGSESEKIMEFLEKFSSLDDDELKEISIPFHIIYKIAMK